MTNELEMGLENDDVTALEFQGQYAACKVFTTDIEQHAVAQIYGFLNCEVFDGCRIRIMPDVHAGKGAVIGFTTPINPEPLRIIPNVIGVDIGCGVQSINLTNQNPDKLPSRLAEFDKHLRAKVPSGFSSLDRPSQRRRWLYQWYFGQGSNWDQFEADVENLAVRAGTDPSKVWCQCGSLGGGNHFIEIGKGTDDSLWLTVHSGSRNFGLKVATFHQNKAVQRMGRKGGLEWLEGDEAKMYLRDMRLAQKFAMLNRLVMLDALTDFFDLKMKDVPLVTSVHNFIGDDDIIRKGAISAREGESVIIPFNMAEGIIMGVGKGNPDWNFSAPHGAGRKMSRGDAKRSIPMADYKKVMKDAGVWSSCVNQGTLDEAPQAYKSVDGVLAFVKDTVEITNRLKPIYNFKAGGEREE